MNLHNVSTIMAPNLFSTGKGKRDSPKTQTFQLDAANKCFKVVRLLIHYEKVLGVVPGFLLNQIRPAPSNKGFNVRCFLFCSFSLSLRKNCISKVYKHYFPFFSL